MRSTRLFSLMAIMILATVLRGCTLTPSKPGANGAKPSAITKASPSVRGTQGPTATKAAPTVPTVVARSAREGDVTLATLSNGMTVIVKPVRTSPVVTVKSYVRTGPIYEQEFLGCGLSHLLEHLVADDATHAGAEPAKGKVVGNRVTQIGGQSNAYTARDHTCYYISASSSKTNQCIDLVADWMARPKFTEADFKREHGVVQRELEKGKDEPNRQAGQAFMQNAFPGHPASVPIIGLAEPLRNVTWQDLKAYHARTYIPQNMIFVVVGDVYADEVLAHVQKALAGFERGRVTTRALPAVRTFTGVRRYTQAQKGLSDVIASVSFQSIDLLHDDLYALDVLAYVLGTGRSSRLYRTVLREKKLVTSVMCSSWTPAWGTGTFTVRFRTKGDDVDGAQEAIIGELWKVVTGGVEPDELVRAKRLKVADWVYSQQTADDIASTLATDYMSTGDVLFSQNYTKRIQAVTVQQVRDAARKYFTFDKMAVTRLVPKLDATAAAGAKSKTFDKQVFTIPGGPTVILQPAETGLVAMTYVVKGGVMVESNATNGLGSLMMALSTRGSKSFTAEEISAFFDSAGGSIRGSTGNNSFYWQATVLEDSLDKALDVFAESILQPTLAKKELDILRPMMLARIRQNDEHWYGQLNKFFRSKFFPKSPYGLMTTGTTEVVDKATVDDLRRFHEHNVVTSKGVLAIYGRFDAAKVRDKVSTLFVPPAGAMAPVKFAGKPRTVGPDGEQHVLKTDKKQAAVMVAAPGMKVTSADRYAMAVLDTIISGYHLPSGWMHDELRGKQLVYVVHSTNWAGLLPGTFMTYAACQPEKAPLVVGIITKNLRRAASYTPSQEEVDLAVNTILTAEVLESQAMSDLAMGAALDELYGLGHDYRKKIEKLYRAVTPADVLRVGRKYLSGGYVVTVTTPKPELFGK